MSEKVVRLTLLFGSDKHLNNFIIGQLGNLADILLLSMFYYHHYFLECKIMIVLKRKGIYNG